MYLIIGILDLIIGIVNSMGQYVLLDFSKLSYFLIGREFFYEFFDNLPSNLGLNYL